MDGRRVAAEQWGELYLVRVDSTGPHNRAFLRSDGDMSPAVLAQIDLALRNAPRGSRVALALHHHVVRLPEENVWERLATLLGLPNAREIPLSAELLQTLRGRCDLVLHGHRHVPRATTLWEGTLRPL